MMPCTCRKHCVWSRDPEASHLTLPLSCGLVRGFNEPFFHAVNADITVPTKNLVLIMYIRDY